MMKYEDTIIKCEVRWGNPPSQDVIDNAVNAFKKSGVKGWVCSGVNGHGLPLYPSQVYPKSHQHANFDWLNYLFKHAGENNITVISWLGLGLASPVAEKHKDYLRVYYEDDILERGGYARLCLNSPYMEYLKGLIGELIEIGFDGIWFDDNSITNMDGGSFWTPGCKCKWCKELFFKEAGLLIPEKINYEDTLFEAYLNWRYRNMVENWQEIIDTAKRIKPEATICLNSNRRMQRDLQAGWNIGMPLRRLKLDALISNELNGIAGEADLQAKTAHAFGFGKGYDTWNFLGVDWSNCDPEPEAILQCAFAALNAECGVMLGTNNTNALAECGRLLIQKVEPSLPYHGGKLIPYATLWISEQTMDYDGREEPRSWWQRYHGAAELFNYSHHQYEVVFDDMLEDLADKGYKVLVAVDNTCVSDKQWASISSFVDNGGVAVICGNFGSRYENGNERPKSIVSDILKTEVAYIPAIRGDGEGKLQRFVGYSPHSPWISFGEYPQHIYATGKGWWEVINPEDSEILCNTMFDCAYEGMNPDTGLYNKTRGAGIIAKNAGKGYFVYMNTEPFSEFLQNPTRYFIKLFSKILDHYAPHEIGIEAPVQVTVNMFEKDECYVVHLHNNPGPVYRQPNTYWSVGVPAGVDNIKLVLPFEIGEAKRLIEKKDISVEGNMITMSLGIYDVIVIEKRREK